MYAAAQFLVAALAGFSATASSARNFAAFSGSFTKANAEPNQESARRAAA